MLQQNTEDEPIRIGIDVGGTFTDVLLLDSDGKRWHVKVRSTPEDSSIGVLEGLEKVLGLTKISPQKANYLLHGTTIATNSILQRKGATTSLITTKGFEDLLEIGRQQRPKLYDLFVERILPLVARENIVGVEERILANGNVHQSLNSEDAKRVVKQARQNADVIAVCLLFSFKNPLHEERLQEEIQRQDSSIPISVSSVVLPEYREYERMSTTVLNAYVTPVLTQYLQHLEMALRKIGLQTPILVMHAKPWRRCPIPISSKPCGSTPI